MTTKIATQHPTYSRMVTLPSGVVTSAESARKDGYTIANGPDSSPEPIPQPTAKTPERAWRTSILKLPEAAERSSAAVEIVTQHSPTTMSVDAARAFLRGLPTERAEAPKVAKQPVDPRSARRAEISNSMTAFNRNNGYAVKKSGKVAPSLSDIDPTKLKRLAEIRLGALTLRMERGEIAVSNERKKLAYAMSVHSQTGLPLATVFTQLGVDTSKMLKEPTK